jgi:hypothetical protein
VLEDEDLHKPIEIRNPIVTKREKLPLYMDGDTIRGKVCESECECVQRWQLW